MSQPHPIHLVWKGSLMMAIGTSAVAAGAWGVAATLRNAAGHPAQQAAAPLPDDGPLPDFTVVDQMERPLHRSDLLGSVWIADFIFTRCAGQCPMMTGQMKRLQRALTREPGIRFVSFSVDPGYDTPDRLAAYAEQSGADTTSWRFVTEAGTPAGAGVADGNPDGAAGGMASPITSIHQLAQQGFRLGVSEDGTAEEPITHSVRLALIDRRGDVRGYYDATDEQAMTRLRHDVHRLRDAGTR